MVSILKHVALGAAISFTVSFSAFADQAPYQEGVHYTQIGVPSKEDTLTEYYSVFCPACYRFTPLMDKLEASLPKNINVEYAHVNFMKHAPVDVQRELTFLLHAGFAVDREEGKTFQSWVFDKIHNEKWRPETTDAIWLFINQSGVDKRILEKANNPEFRDEVERYLNTLMAMVNADSILGTPTLIVSDAYRVEVGALNKNDPFGDLVNLITHLANKE